jgi:hypothetical protein
MRSNTTSSLLVIACSLTLAASTACAARAQQTRASARPAAAVALAPRIAQMRELAIAADLGAYGRAHADPLALLSAARILLDVGWSPLEAAPVGAGQVSAETGTAIDPAALIAQARTLAADNPHLAALADALDTRARATPRGAEGGVKTRDGSLGANAAHNYEVVFLGEQPAAVYIAAAGGGSFECAIYDAGGRRVASDSRRDNDCLITWWPDRRATFRIEVRNAREAESIYLLMTN